MNLFTIYLNISGFIQKRDNLTKQHFQIFLYYKVTLKVENEQGGTSTRSPPNKCGGLRTF